MIAQHKSVINEYSASVKYNVTVFWLYERHAMKNPLIITIYSVTKKLLPPL